jgi:hypothetical protein
LAYISTIVVYSSRPAIPDQERINVSQNQNISSYHKFLDIDVQYFLTAEGISWVIAELGEEGARFL